MYGNVTVQVHAVQLIFFTWFTEEDDLEVFACVWTRICGCAAKRFIVSIQ